MKKNELEINMKLDGEEVLSAIVEVDLALVMKKFLQIVGGDDLAAATMVPEPEEDGSIDTSYDDPSDKDETEPPKEPLTEIVNGNNICRYDAFGTLVESEKTEVDANGDAVTYLVRYTPEHRTSSFIKSVNGKERVRKMFGYDNRGTVIYFSYLGYYENGKIRTNVSRKYIRNEVHETLLPSDSNKGNPIMNTYPGCHMDRYGDVIHDITGIHINANNFKSLL